MIISALFIAMLAPGTTAPAPRQPDKVICKRFEVTGSAVKKEKICHTRADWAKIKESTQNQWSALQGTLGSTRGN